MSLEFDKIYNMDCVEGLKKLDSDSIDLIVTSPPYNVGIDYDSWNDNMAWEDYLNWCREWLKECFRVLKDDGRICINHYIAFSPKEDKDRFPLFDFRNIMEDIGYTINKIAIWEDRTMTKMTAWGSWLSASSPYLNTPYEGILIGYKKQWKKKNSGISTIDKDTFLEGVSGIWNLGTTIGKTKACFPESLPNMCIQLFSYKDDVVLDPFMGSGTTAVVAKRTGRHFVGFEISKNYCSISNARLIGSAHPEIVQETDGGVVLSKQKFDID